MSITENLTKIILRSTNTRAFELFNLREQYQRATGEELNITNRHSVKHVLDFYSRRQTIGLSLLAELANRRYNVIDRSCMEIGHSIYDSLGIKCNNTIITSDPIGLIKYNPWNQTPIGYKRFNLSAKGKISLTGTKTISETRGWTIEEEIDLSSITSFLLLNPITSEQTQLFVDIFNANDREVFFGYYGFNSDIDQAQHLEEVKELSQQAELINVDINGGYGYVLHKSQK